MQLGSGRVKLVRALGHYWPVAVEIEKLDDLAVGFEGVRYGDVTAQHGCDALGEQRLAVTGCAEEEERFTGVHSSAHLVQQFIAEDHPLERTLDYVFIDRWLV